EFRLVWQQYVWRGEKHDPRASPFPLPDVLTRFGDQDFSATLGSDAARSALGTWEDLAFARRGRNGRERRADYRFGELSVQLLERDLSSPFDLKSSFLRFRLAAISRYPWLDGAYHDSEASGAALGAIREGWRNAGMAGANTKTVPEWKHLFVPCRIHS